MHFAVMPDPASQQDKKHGKQRVPSYRRHIDRSLLVEICDRADKCEYAHPGRKNRRIHRQRFQFSSLKNKIIGIVYRLVAREFP